MARRCDDLGRPIPVQPISLPDCRVQIHRWGGRDLPVAFKERNFPVEEFRVCASSAPLDDLGVEGRSAHSGICELDERCGRTGVVIVAMGEEDLGEIHLIEPRTGDLFERSNVRVLTPRHAGVDEDEARRLPDRVDIHDRSCQAEEPVRKRLDTDIG